MDALDSCSPSPLSLVKDLEESICLFICLIMGPGPCGWTSCSRQYCTVHLHTTLSSRDGNAGPFSRTREEANWDILWKKPFHSFRSLLRGSSNSNDFIRGGRGYTRKSFPMLWRSVSHTFLPHSAIWQCLSGWRQHAQGDPQLLITGNYEGKHWAGRVHDC